MPLVAPTKMATNPGGNVVAILRFDSWTVPYLTMIGTVGLDKGASAESTIPVSGSHASLGI